MMKKSRKSSKTIDARRVDGYVGSGTYALALDAAGAVIRARRISSDVIHPDCVGPDRGAIRTNGGAAHAAALEFAADTAGQIVLAIGSCYELSNISAPWRR